MPVVPRTTGPSVGQTITPNARLTVRADPSGPNAMASAMRQAAGVAQGFYEQEKAKADEAAILQARMALSGLEDELFDPENPKGILAKRGSEALGAMDLVSAEYEKRRMKIEAGLRNDDQRRAFARISFDFGDQLKGRVRTYAMQENEAYVEATEKASLQSVLERASLAASEGRDDALAREVTFAHQQIELQGRRKGLPAEAIALQKDAFTSQTLVTSVQSMVTQGNAAGALQFWQANADDLTAEDRTRLAPQMRRVELGVRETEEANRIMASHGTGSGAVRAAEKIADPELRDLVISRIDSEAGRRERAQRQAEQAYTESVLRKLLNSDPALPLEQVLSPEDQLRMDPRDVMTARNFRASLLRGEEVQTDPREYQRLWMMTDKELAATNVRQLVLERKLSPGDADRFLQRQQEILNPQPGKFRWESEADMYRQAELSMGVDPSTPAGKRDAGKFRMAADRAIAEREAELDRSMTREEKWKVMNELMLPMTRERSFLGIDLAPASVRAYEARGQEDVYLDPQLVARARADLEAKLAPGDAPLTDADVIQYLQSNAERFNRGSARNGQ